MSSNMKNIKGTLLPSFKFRASGGIELISAAIKTSNGTVSRFRVKDSDGVHDVAYYDTVIASENIRKFKYISTLENGIEIKYFVLTLNDNTEITLPMNVNSANLQLPEDAEEDEIAIYKKEDGNTVMGRSEVKILKTLPNGGLTDSPNTIPTSGVVESYVNQEVGVPREMLAKRLNREGVSLPSE